MQVTSSQLTMAATHTESATTQVQGRLEVRQTAASPAPASSSEAPTDGVEITDKNVELAKWLYEYFTGHKAPRVGIRPQAGGSSAASPGQAAVPRPAVSYTRQEIHHEAESTSFTAAGNVTLASGQSVNFSLKLDMNREETEIRSVTFGTGNTCDPVAVNLDGAGVRLSGEKQAFDLNGDGLNETIATLAQGSAWLAEDRNGNGTVDSGKELFGPATGSGFGELAALDTNGDGWITEGDAAYDHLGLWSGGQLTSLKDAGIGALAVSGVATPFTLKDGAEVLGQVESSSVYLRENGTPGALQEVDLTV